MTEIIKNKCVQVQIFREKLRSVKKGATFVESTYNDKWGSGLNKTGTENTKISSWPGKNILGQFIQKVAKKIRKRKRSDQWSKAKQKSKSKQDLKQQDISKMLRNLRSQSDSDSFSGIDASSDSDEETSAASGKG